MADVSFTFTGDSINLMHVLADIKNEVGQTKEAVGSVATQITAAFAAVTAAYASVKGAFAGIVGISNAAAEMEQTGLAMRVMLKDADKAAQYMSALRLYAAETPFEFQDISEAAKTLLSMGTASDKSIKVIKQLGDVASASGVSLKELAFIYAKAQNAGLTNEVAEQFETRFVPIRQLLAEIKGISFEDVFKGISKRQFGLEDVDAVLAKITGPGGLLESMTALQSQTFSGVFSTLTDNIGNMGVELGTPINAAIIPVMQEIIAGIDTLTPLAKEVGQTIASAFSGVGEVMGAVNSALEPLIGSMGAVKVAIGAAVAGLVVYIGTSKQAANATEEVHLRLLTLKGSFRGLNVASIAAAFRSSLASMQASAASAFASIRATMTLNGIQAALTSTLAGVRNGVKATLASVNSGINAALSSIRTATVATLAGMRVAWNITWASMAAAARTAMVAVKAALVSTGIGLVIVAIGEALAALYSWFMRSSEAAKEASASYEAFVDRVRELEDMRDKVSTEEGGEEYKKALEAQMRETERQLRDAKAADNDKLAAQLSMQLSTLKKMRDEADKYTKAGIEARKQSEYELAVLKAKREEVERLQQRLEDARKKMGDLVAAQAKKEQEQRFQALTPEQEIKARLSFVGFENLEALKAAMDAMERRVIHDPDDADKYAAMVEAYNRILALQKEVTREAKKTADEAKKKKETEEAARADYAMKLSILQAEIAGDEKRLQYLKDEQRVAELTAQYRRQGLADAETAARRMVAAEIEAAAVREEQGKKDEARVSRMSSSWIQTSKASVGGGGRSYLVGGEAILAESKKQTNGILQCRDRIDKLRSTPIKVEVTSVIGE